MRNRGVSGAYRELGQALAATGRSISATQLERWAYWRTGGLIDRPQRHGAGRGTRSSFPNLGRVRDQAAAVADVLRPRMRLDAAALLLHGEGHQLLDEDVKAAVVAELEATRKRFLRNARTDATADPHQQAWNAAWAAYRVFSRGERAQRRRRARAELPNPQAWAVAEHILLGHDITRADLETLLDTLSIPDALVSRDGVSQIESLVEHASFTSLIATVAARPASEVAQVNQTSGSIVSLVGAPFELAGLDRLGLQLGITIGRLLGFAHGEYPPPLDLPADLGELLTAEVAR